MSSLGIVSTPWSDIHTHRHLSADGPWEIPSGVQKYSLAELAKATNNWSESNEIGQGGFGKVFHGVFEDGKMVAIKRASDSSTQGTSEFRNEVVLLSRLHHRHLVRLEGFCDDRGLQANSLTSKDSA